MGLRWIAGPRRHGVEAAEERKERRQEEEGRCGWHWRKPRRGKRPPTSKEDMVGSGPAGVQLPPTLRFSPGAHVKQVSVRSEPAALPDSKTTSLPGSRPPARATLSGIVSVARMRPTPVAPQTGHAEKPTAPSVCTLPCAPSRRPLPPEPFHAGSNSRANWD